MSTDGTVSRVTFILLDLTTLIETALDQPKHATLVRSAPVASLKEGSRLLLATLDRNFPTIDRKTTESTEHFEESYEAAVAVLQKAGVALRADPGRYADQRSQWDTQVCRVGPALGHDIKEIDCRKPLLELAGSK